MKEKFVITGMTCSACSARVEKVTRALPGVTRADVNLLAGTMVVDYREGQCSRDKIIAAVTHGGYGAALYTESRMQDRSDPSVPMKRRLILSFCFLLPLMYVSMGHMAGLPLPAGIKQPFIFALTQFCLTVPLVLIHFRYFARGIPNLLHGAPNMDSLIAVGSGASLLYGVYTLLKIAAAAPEAAAVLSHDLYFEGTGMILTLVSLGKYFETRSKGKTGQAIQRLMDLSPKTALVLRDGGEQTVSVEQVRPGDLLLIKPGAAVPVDGIVQEGLSALDESALTGESIPVEKKPGDTLSAATINKTGSLIMKATRVGSDTTLSEIIRLVEEAGSSKAPIARLADKISGIFVPVVMAIALVTGVIWLLAGKTFDFALTRAIAVLVISCPCALGLATPVSIMVGTGQGAKYGILFKSAEALELLSRMDTAVLDKTGTLTEGKPHVTDILPEAMSGEQFLYWAASLEKDSEHPLAAAVVEAAGTMVTDKAEKFEAVPGRGVRGILCGKTVLGGNRAFLEEAGISVPDCSSLTQDGKTLLYFAVDGAYAGVIAAADREKPHAAEAVAQLKQLGLQVILLTGDNEAAARVVGNRLGIERVIAQVLPGEKELHIRKLQESGHKVLMVGDGINDAPALARAHVGTALGAGTDIAMDSADVVLMGSDPLDICTGVELSRSVIGNIRLSLFWAFFYNILGIPIAAGVLIPLFGLQLSPMLAAAAMSCSSLCVVTNALRLRKFRPGREKYPENKTMKGSKTMITLEITGMMCPHCQAHVQTALESVPGVTAVSVDLQGGKATVDGGETEALVKAVVAAGYGCKAL